MNTCMFTIENREKLRINAFINALITYVVIKKENIAKLPRLHDLDVLSFTVCFKDSFFIISFK